MSTFAGSEAAWVLPAGRSAVRVLRHRAMAFAVAAGASDELVERIAFAVTETVGNVIVHAYGEGGGPVRVSCHVEGGRVVVEVRDEGVGIGPRGDSPGIGHGLTIVGALAQTLEIGPGSDGRGTVVTMAFGSTEPAESEPGLEFLCDLALETIADVSCVDLISEGVLRRVAAQVAGEPELTSWLLGAMPPAKPGTATWTALRERGPSLVVHDPTVPRSPGGPGEHLNLTWWIAVALPSGQGTPEALWGFGGRESGRAVPTDEVVRIIGDAAQGDLAQAAERAVLRAQLEELSP